MRQALVFLLFIFLTFACSDLEQFETKPMNLGVKASNTEILSIVSQGAKTTVTYNLTVGAKYSVQVYEFGKTDPTKTLPLTAEEEIVTKVYDFADLKDGIYDITLTDIAGTSIKKPLIIKR
jgi:hypothetical protein